eukprot:TRINITY_DN4393_c0_g2_i1.p1 TRINITY_DN4393_c0_g2~~TRINITY_DN4393_c0_g2_i1.p1  ORF type:complete len:177 (-),score=50.27 TRINITY_DN4393_c0_g2_i1:30-560(-)
MDLTSTYKRAKKFFKKREFGFGEDEEDEDLEDEVEDGFEITNVTLDITLKFPDVVEHPVYEGDNVEYGYILTNTLNDPTSLHLYYKVWATDYTDKVLFDVSEVTRELTLSPGETSSVLDVIEPKQYMGLFTGQLEGEDMGFLKFELTVQVDGESDNFIVNERHLFIHVNENERYFK